MDKSKAKKINNWSCYRDPFHPPESTRLRLNGQCDEDVARNLYRTTSDIVEIDGLYIRTYSGSVYELGEISKDYMVWLKNHYPKDIDPANPIKMVEKLTKLKPLN